MSKKIKIVLAILVIFSLSCIGYMLFVSNATNDDRMSEKRSSVKGTWVIESISTRGEVIEGTDLQDMYGGNFIYDFTNSTEVLMGVAPSLETCKYSQQGAIVTISFKDEVIATYAMLDDNTMVSDNSDIVLTLVRE